MKPEYLSGLSSRFSLTSVDDISATITMTATVRFWKEAAQTLEGSGYGAWQVRAAVEELIRQASRHFEHQIDSGDKPAS